MNNKNILVFLPNELKFSKLGELEGYYKKYEDSEAFYITNNNVVNNSKHAIGNVVKKFNISNNTKKSVQINMNSKEMIVHNNPNTDITSVSYDLDAFKFSQVLTLESDIFLGTHFKFLSEILKISTNRHNKNGHKSLINYVIIFLEAIIQLGRSLKPIIKCSSTISHFFASLVTFAWCVKEFEKDKGINPKVGNIISSKIFDLIVGLILLNFLIQYEGFILNLISETRELIIHNLKDLLTYLMGSPIGLKLNKAFNNCLGTFFFYHISLWRIFLITMHPILEKYFLLLVLPAAFGVSFQVTMLTDIISVATFHVYCIYVYAARLIHLQLNCLWSLFQLFIGRKFNPLRQKVDSYEYSQNQLFIGTLGFTVLLFLLPTTLLYYTVFTLFRLAIITLNRLLFLIRNLLNKLPIYIFGLWLFKSPQISGNLNLRWQKSSGDTVNIHVLVNILPLMKCIEIFSPEDIQNAELLPPWNVTFKQIFTGLLI